MEIFLHKEDMPSGCYICDFCKENSHTCADECIADGYEYIGNAQMVDGRLKSCPLRCLEENDYRKTDEVRKETAKEVLQKLYDWFGIARNSTTEFILRLAEQYGVEVK